MDEFKALLHPRPDEMTFGQSLEHARKVMYWDYVDGVWHEVSLCPIGFWDALSKQLMDAHDREVGTSKAELEELVSDMWRLLFHWLFKAGSVPCEELDSMANRMMELGIEVE